MIKLQNYNEFKNGVRWHDYFTIMVNEFPIILVRKYDWHENDTYTFMVQVMGVKVYQHIGEYK
jgi:hypothetical protein